MGGTEAMRQAGEDLLPREPKESLQAYRLRVSRSYLFNGFRRTVESLAGKAFRKPVALGQDVPRELETWSWNFDLTGRDVSEFGRALLQDTLSSGLSFILVDHPPAVPGSTLADQRQRGDRPYATHVRAVDALGIRSTRVGGVEMVTRARIAETVPDLSSPWSDDGVIHQVRVLEPGRWAVYRQTSRKDWVLHEQGTTSLPYVPLFPVYGRRTGFCDGRSPLSDLAWLNLAHWQSYSDYRNILRTASVGFMFGAGIDKDSLGGQFDIGPNRMLVVADPQAKLGYVEHSGAALGSLREHLDSLKEEMAVLGAEMLVRQEARQRTATEVSLNSSESDSQLAAVVDGLSGSLTAAAQAMADFAGLGDCGTWTVSTDFADIPTSQSDLTTLLQLRATGELSRETLYAELQRRGLLSEAFDAAIEGDRLAAEPPRQTTKPVVTTE
ncbi:DUF4055 domain-containing protein [Teichococcus rhizosphaerae]|nr:DUF4055 domain-containing protein [Pseudoroseomonas rhizosphaerae]